MAKPSSALEVAGYHQDTNSALRLFFSELNPDFLVRFGSYTLEQFEAELASRLNETDLRSSLAILTRLEAAFRVDYKERCDKKGADAVSMAFRAINKDQGRYVRLDDDILETWKAAYPQTAQLVRELKGAFRFRHWLAHGMYWHPKLARKYDYQWVYTLAANVLADFPLHGQEAQAVMADTT